MTDREALIRAICDHPDADTPRLIFADWCEENGEAERAEFIRIGVELARLPAPQYKTVKSLFITHDVFATGVCIECSKLPVKCRYHELKADWDKRCEPFPPHAPASLRRFKCEWSRGFVKSISCEWKDWLFDADRITSEHPIETVDITGGECPFIKDGTLYRLHGHEWHRIPNGSHIPTELCAVYWPRIKLTFPAEVDDFSRITGQLLYQNIRDQYLRDGEVFVNLRSGAPLVADPRSFIRGPS